MASQEEAVASVAPAEEEEVKKVESGGEFSVNGAPIDSFNSRISSDVGPGDVDMAESQVAVAGSVDSAAEAPVSAGAEPSASADTGSASSGDVVDATEKVESWDLSEAVQEGGANKEESKPIFSEDGTLADSKTQASSDLIAAAPASAASVEDSAEGVSLIVPSADVEEKTVEVSSEDVGVVSEKLPAEVAVSEDVNPKFQDEGSAEKGDSEARESPVEEVHDIGEAVTSAVSDKEVAGVEAVPSPSADVEEKSVDVEDKPVDFEDKPVDVEDKPVDVEDKPADVEDKSVDVADKSVEVNSEDAGVLSKELSAQDAATEEVSPETLDEGSAKQGDSEVSEPPVELVNEVADTTTGVEPVEAVASPEAVPSPSADVEEKSLDIEDKSVDVEDKPVHVEDKPIDVADKSVDIEDRIVEVNSEDAGIASEVLPAEVDASEAVSPKISDEASDEKGDNKAPKVPEEEVQEVAEAPTSAEPGEEVASLEAGSSPFVDLEEKSVELDSEDAGAGSEDVRPKIEAEESAAEGASEALEAPEEGGQEVAEATEPDEEVASVEAVPSPSVDLEERSVELGSEDAGAVSEDVSPKVEAEESAETGASEAPEAPVEEEVKEVAEAATSAEPGEDVASLEAVPSPSVDLEERSVELGSEDGGAVSEDVSPRVEAEESAETGASEAPEAPEAPVEEEVKEVAEAATSAEPGEDVASLEAVPSPSVDLEERSVELDPEDAEAVSEDVSSKAEAEESAETGASEAPEAPVEEEVHEVAEATTSAEPAEEVASVEALPSPSVDVEGKSVEEHSEDAGAVSEEASPRVEEGSAEKGDNEAPEDEVHEVAEATTSAEPGEEVASVEAVPSPSVDLEEKSVELDPEDGGAVSEDLRPKIEAEESAAGGASEAPEAPEEGGQEVAEATEPDEEVASLEAVPSPSVDIAEKSVELGSEDAGAVSEDVSPKVEAEESAETGASEAPEAPVEEEVHEVAEATTSAEPAEEVASVEALPSPSVDVEGKSVEEHSEDAGAVSEEASPRVEEGSAEKGDNEAPEDEVHEVAEAATSAEPAEEVASVEALPSPSVDLEERSVELGSEDAGAVSEDVSSKVEAKESAETGASEAPEAPLEEVHEVAEAATSAEPAEEVASVEALPSPSFDVEGKSVEEHSEDAGAVSEDASLKIEEGASEAPEAAEEEAQEVAGATTSTEPAEAVASLEALSSRSVDVEEKAVEADHSDPSTIAEVPEETASLESAPAPAEDSEEKSVQEVDSKDISEASDVLPSESTDRDDISPEPPAEGGADNVGSETLFVPDEEVHEVVEATISAEPDEVPREPGSALAPSDVVEEKSVDVNPADAIGVITASEGIDKKGVSPEPSSEAVDSAGTDASLESGAVEGSASLESGVDEGSASLESVSSSATNVEDRSFEVNPEDTSEAKIELPTESADKEDVSPELPAEGSADNVGSEALFTPAEEVHEVVEAMIAPEPDEGSTSPESGPAPDDVEEKPEELSEATTTELPHESVDKEVVSRDLAVEEVHAPMGKTEDAAADAESADVQTGSETISREFNFNNLKGALTTSNDVTSEEVATATGEEGSSSDAVASDTTPLEISSPPPAVENKEAPKSYDLHEVAVHLEDAAEKTLEDVKSSVVGDRQASVAESVAQIVLEESGKTGDSSELISGVIQHVAQLAQDDFQSDPNVLPDTVNQVFDRDMAGSPANEASHPKETTSLGTKFSLFVVWCISLCASHVSSKDMPTPALKLGAEEVAAVLHSNAQGAASSKAASSV